MLDLQTQKYTCLVKCIAHCGQVFEMRQVCLTYKFKLALHVTKSQVREIVTYHWNNIMWQ